ncbi:MAG TPA: trypsin-like peptidase domain-containing protein [Terriglobales bacterium]
MTGKIWAALSEEMTETSAEAGKSVVSVEGRRHPSSGIIFTNDSVITANHALRREDETSIVLAPDRRIPARVAGRDPSTDLALLRLEEPIQSPPARWGNGSDLKVGELLLALARTRRGNIVVSSGVLSGYINQPWRTWLGGDLDQFIRPDLNLYAGFSGGPLLNGKAEFLGVNTSAFYRGGITIPATTVLAVAGELLGKGRIERPYLGLAMQAAPLPESLRTKLNLTGSEGLLVMRVEPASPADRAGVLLGDVLLKLGDQALSDTDAVQDQLRSHKPGDEIQAAFIRGGEVVNLKMKLEARPAR